MKHRKEKITEAPVDRYSWPSARLHTSQEDKDKDIINSSTLQIRGDTKWREIALHVTRYPNSSKVQETGIKGTSIFIVMGIKSMLFPRSFPIEAMHLFYGNLFVSITKHLCGIFFSSFTNIDGLTTAYVDSNSEQSSSNEENVPPNTSNRRKAKQKVRKAADFRKPPPAKFKVTHNPRNIRPDTCKLWSGCIISSKNTIPAA